MRDGSPAFVTVFAHTDSPGGWRRMPHDSGAVLDVVSGEAVTRGLAMPHSPRWHDGNLFVLSSGMGRLERVDPATGQREDVAVLPGYAGDSRSTGISPSSACRGSVRPPSSVGYRSRPTTSSSSAASALSSSAPAAPSRRSSSPTPWRRSSTCSPLPARGARPSVTRPTETTRSGCFRASGRRLVHLRHAQRSENGPGPVVHWAPVCSRKASTASVIVS